jgi:hypothetical protein
MYLEQLASLVEAACFLPALFAAGAYSVEGSCFVVCCSFVAASRSLPILMQLCSLFLMSTSTKEWNRLPETTELELLKILSNPTLNKQRFYTLCDCNKAIFGEKSSELRRRVIARRNYLRSNPAALVKNLEEFAQFIAAAPESVVADSKLLSPSPHQHPPSPSPFFYLQSSPFDSKRQPSTMSESKSLIGNSSNHDISLTEPWMNGDSGVFALYAQGAKFDNAYKCMRIDLYLPIVDVVDFHQGRYKVYMSEDYSTIEWMVPSIPGYFVRKHSYVQDSAGKDFEDPQVIDRHKEICTKFGKKAKDSTDYKNQHLLLHMKRLKLPPGITANNGKFNKGKEGTNELAMRLHRADVRKPMEIKDPNDATKTKNYFLDQSHFYGVVTFYVDGSKVQLEEEEASQSEADQLATLFGGKVTFAE